MRGSLAAVFVITEMYRVFLSHWQDYVRAARRVNPEWFGRRDERGRALARAIDALDGCLSEDAPKAQSEVIALMSEMQAFMRDHPAPGGEEKP